jgi:tetratricopeptide (TPR) repeat protein
MSAKRGTRGSPGSVGALLDSAMRAHQAGDLVTAQALYAEVLRASPRNFGALYALGVSYCQEGQHARGVPLLEQALAVEPDYAEAHSNLASALNALSRHNEAVAHGERAVALDPACAEAYCSLGNALHALGRYEEAIVRYEQALALKPNLPEVYFNLGNALRALARNDEAVVRYEQALALNPAYAEAHNNVGNALHAVARPDEAIAHYEQALVLNPASSEAHGNLGNALHALGRDDEAIAHYEQALAIEPDFADAEHSMSSSLLALGRLAEGWQPYEARWRVKGVAGLPDFQCPLWLGAENIAGKTILLHAEQGLGDTIQFCRYAALVAQQGARVILEVQPALRTLLADIQGPHQIVARGDTLPDFDCHCPLLSLPLALGTRLETIPAPVPYLAAQPDLVARWEAVLGPKERSRIGIAWAGSPGYKDDRKRSIPLRRLRPLLTAGASVVSLHHEVCAADLEVLDAHPEILQFGEELRDFTDMAALVTLLDLVISVDTSVVHLAGALGKPVWVLLPFAPDWRWTLDRTDSPWYPTARLFRQPCIGDWDSVIRTVVERLAEFGAPL